MKYNVKVEEHTIELDHNVADSIDAVSIVENVYHVLDNDKAYKAEVLETDFDNKTMTIAVNGNKYNVSIEDEYDQLVKQMGLSVVSSTIVKDIKAPMPGLIIDILVEPGQAFEKGTPLLILEAMKMENVIKADGEGTVSKINTEKGNAVEKGQVLIEC